jgi:membrane-associated phospholipid phosphatase
MALLPLWLIFLKSYKMVNKKLFFEIIIIAHILFFWDHGTTAQFKQKNNAVCFIRNINSSLKLSLLAERSTGDDISIFAGSIGNVLSSPFHWESNDVYNAGGFILLSAGTFLLDGEARKVFLKNRNSTLDKLEPVGYAYGAPQNAAAGALLIYFSGLASNNNWLRNTGLMLTETLIVIGIIQVPARIISGRARPYTGYGNTSFKFLKGFEQDRASFISGHAAVAFGISNILSHQIDHPATTAALFCLAALTPLARLYADKHWFSDVMIGSALGLFVSNSIINYHEKSGISKNKFSIMPALNGILFCYSFN